MTGLLDRIWQIFYDGDSIAKKGATGSSCSISIFLLSSTGAPQCLKIESNPIPAVLQPVCLN
jgi:hypothetical protein